MTELNVKIINLPAGKMVSIYAFGEQPEDLAWKKVETWLAKNNLQLDPSVNRIFGFNNPCPSIGSTRYGYEFILNVGIEVEPADDVRIIDFPGGLYAVTEIQIQDGAEIPGHWKALNLWCEKSSYRMAQHQWLEEHSFEGMPFALYLPIKE